MVSKDGHHVNLVLLSPRMLFQREINLHLFRSLLFQISVRAPKLYSLQPQNTVIFKFYYFYFCNIIPVHPILSISTVIPLISFFFCFQKSLLTELVSNPVVLKALLPPRGYLAKFRDIFASHNWAMGVQQAFCE